MTYDSEFGRVEMKLDECIEKSGLSKNKVAFRAELQRTQLNNYCKGEIQRDDFAVLARLCHVLKCDISDILCYIPPKAE